MTIKQFLTSKGYRYLGKGVYQEAYLAPDGTVLKVYKSVTKNKFSKQQQSFIDFAKFCRDNPNNPFLPYFFGWETFKWNEKLYLQIKSERLFPIKTDAARLLERLITYIEHPQQIRVHQFTDLDIGRLTDILGGVKQSQEFIRTVQKLNNIAEKKGYRLDLHQRNFMYGSDGQVVINDPFA